MKSKTELPMMIARGVAVAAKVIAALLLLAVIFVVLVFALEFPSMRKYNRLCDYPNKDALLAAEPDKVKKVVDFSQNGTNYTAVVLSWIGFLPSGPAVFIYGDGVHSDGRDSGMFGHSEKCGVNRHYRR